MSDNLIFPDTPGGLPSRDPAADLATTPEAGTPAASDYDADTSYDISFDDAPSFDDAADPVVSGDGADVAADPKPAAAPKKAKKSRSRDGLLLGVHVTAKQVYGVLVRPSGDSYEPLRQFVRNRADEATGAMGEAAMSPDEVGADAPIDFSADSDDGSIQFGGVGEIDFSSEFAGLGVATDAAFDAPSTSGALDVRVQPIVFELRDILDECESAGFGRPAVAFAIDAPDVEYAEVVVPPEKKAQKKSKKKKGKKGADSAVEEAAAPETGPVKRDRLVSLLPETGFAYDKSRVAFIPMTARDGLRRYMAIIPTAAEPVVESLGMLREQGSYRKTAFRTLEGEVPLLLGLARMTLMPDEAENTAIVRVGAEDTVVLLLTGSDLHHYEKMQSVTAFDGPDTICSRVLLQQDVQGVGMVHNVVVVAEEREKELVQGFSAFYPEASVTTLREGLARFGLVGPYGPLAPMLIEAAGAALAGHLAKSKDSPFEEANLLPKDLRKRKRSFDLAFGWHTLIAAVALFLSVLFFSYMYVSQNGEIDDAERRLAEFPAEARMSAPQLQARIDSLRLRQIELSASLTALDSLLIDTDRWTQTLLRTTRAAASTGGIWIEEWNPSGTLVTLDGVATTRGNVVGLADRLGATIQEVRFDETREYPVYPYRMEFVQNPELPQITRVMREQAGEPLPAASSALTVPSLATDAPPVDAPPVDAPPVDAPAEN
ncbi:MAG: hypothetical protein AAF845_01045 [Bacteroidota bacterium]